MSQSDFVEAFDRFQRETLDRFLETLRDTPFPPEGVEPQIFAKLIRQFMLSGVTTEEFALSMGVSESTIDNWMDTNPPQRYAQKAVVDWIKEQILNRCLMAPV